MSSCSLVAPVPQPPAATSAAIIAFELGCGVAHDTSLVHTLGAVKMPLPSWGAHEPPLPADAALEALPEALVAPAAAPPAPVSTPGGACVPSEITHAHKPAPSK